MAQGCRTLHMNFFTRDSYKTSFNFKYRKKHIYLESDFIEIMGKFPIIYEKIVNFENFIEQLQIYYIQII